MATTTTFKTLLEEVTERSGFGQVMGTVTGITTGWSGSTSYLKGPFSNQRWPRGSPLLITAGATTSPGTPTYVDQYTAATGAGTIEPDAPDTWTNGIIWPYGHGIDHADRVTECVNRALSLNCCRRQKQPLTFVPDGDYLNSVVTGFWTASAGTASYVDQAYPETISRAVQITHSSAANAVSATIPARGTEQWRFETAIRATTDGDTAAFTIQDVTNTATITPAYEAGTGSTTSRAFVTQKGTFTVPATCDRITFTLGVSGSGTMTAQMAPLVAFPQDARSFPLQQRVTRRDRVGNFFYGYAGGSPTGPEEVKFSEPITLGGRTVSFAQDADHFVVTFNFSPQGPVYYDELVFAPELSAMSDTTTFEKAHVVDWALVYLYELLARHDPKQYAVPFDSAKRAARLLEYESVPSVTAVGRR